jgi:hypothetical protein
MSEQSWTPKSAKVRKTQTEPELSARSYSGTGIPIRFGPLLPVDEYDVYIPGIVQLLENHCTTEQIEAHLVKIAKERYGAAQASKKASLAAKNLVASWSMNG